MAAMSGGENPLSKREQEILELVARGLTNQEIARDLVITLNTVKVHLRNIFAKLDANSRTEAIVKAAQAGWIVVSGVDEADAAVQEAAAGPAGRAGAGAMAAGLLLCGRRVGAGHPAAAGFPGSRRRRGRRPAI